MRKSIKDPFFYNTINMSDFWNVFVRAFTFRYNKYQEDHRIMLDTIFDACGQYKKIGEFMCYRNEEDYFIHNTCNNVIVGWYKHFGRCNCVNVKDFTVNDLYQFFKELRMACYEAGYYHIATPEWKAEQEAAAKAEEIRRSDPAYQRHQIEKEKITRNSMYRVYKTNSISIQQIIKNSENPLLNTTDPTSLYPETLSLSLLDPKHKKNKS